MKGLVSLLGSASLMKKLNQKSEGYNKRAKKAVLAGCLIVQGDAQRMAPYKTGNLRGSIAVEVEETGDGAIGRVGTNVEYAAAQEFGRSDINLPAHPYLRPAIDLNRARIKRTMIKVLKEGEAG